MNIQMIKKIISQLYLIAACVELMMAICSECGFEVPYSRFILWGLLIIYGLKVVSNQYSAREYIFLVLLLFLGVLNYISGGMNAILKASIFLYALRGEDYKKIVRYLLGCLVAVSVIMYMRALALGENDLLCIHDVRLDRGFNGIRYTFGYTHPNRFMGSLFTAIMMLLCILQPKTRNTLIVSGICILTAAVFYYFTDTRTVFFLMIGIVVLYDLTAWVDRKWMYNLTMIIFAMSFSLEVALSLLASCHVDNFGMRVIDKVISGRFQQLGNIDFIKEYAPCYVENWHLFSVYDNQAGCDLGYAFIFYYYGVIASIVFLAFIVYTAVSIYSQRKYYKFAILTGLCTFTFMEIYYFSNYITKNLLLIFCAITVWSSRQGESLNEQKENNIIDHYSCI